MEELMGPLPADWCYKSLGEICSNGQGNIQTGPFGSQLHASDYVAMGIPSIMPQNIGDNRINEQGIARVTEADAERLARHRVPPKVIHVCACISNKSGRRLYVLDKARHFRTHEGRPV